MHLNNRSKRVFEEQAPEVCKQEQYLFNTKEEIGKGNISKDTSKMTRDNIQPHTVSLKPRKVLDPRYETSKLKENLLQMPSQKTQPVYYKEGDEGRLYQSLGFSNFDDRLCPTLPHTGTKNAYYTSDFEDIVFTQNLIQKVNNDHLEKTPTAFDFEGHGDQCIELDETTDQNDVVSVLNVVNVLQDVSLGDSSLTSPAEEKNEILVDDTALDNIVALDHYAISERSLKWNTDENMYQFNLDIDDEVYLSILDSSINTKNNPLENGPMESFQYGHVVYGTLEALKDLSQHHSDQNLQSGKTGIYTKKTLESLTKENSCLIQKIGQGSFGKVSMYQSPQSAEVFVIKEILEKKKFRPTEVLVPSMFDCSNLLKTHGLLLENGVPQIVMDYGGETLLKFATQQKLSEEEIWTLTYQLCSGLKHLAINGIIHFDIKPENCFIIRDAQGLLLRIGDFGSCKLPLEGIDYEAWTPEYMATEMARLVIAEKLPAICHFKTTGKEREDITPKVDVFSAGLVVLYMYCQGHILLLHSNESGDSKTRRLKLIEKLAGDPNMLLNMIPCEVGSVMRNVVCSLLQGDYKKRDSAEEIVVKMNKLSASTKVTSKPSGQKTKVVTKVIGIGPEASEEPEKKITRRRNRRSQSVREKLQAAQKENSEAVVNTVLHDKVMGETPQIRKRLVKKLLKHKLEDRDQVNSSSSLSGKKIRTDSPSSCMDSPLPDTLTIGDCLLNANPNNILPVKGPICQAVGDNMETLPSGNLPNFDLF